MKLSSILGALSFGIGLATATGIEHEVNSKTSLRGQMEEAHQFYFGTEWVPCEDLVAKGDTRSVLSLNCDDILLPKTRVSAEKTESKVVENMLAVADSRAHAEHGKGKEEFKGFLVASGGCKCKVKRSGRRF